MPKITKESYFDVQCKAQEEFESVEQAMQSNRPSENSMVEILNVNITNTKIKTIKEQQEANESKQQQKPQV
tara:strand:+ start:1009 stop:1221 length:213 start_codon:yes stop_codon:yes gene_type:complete